MVLSIFIPTLVILSVLASATLSSPHFISYTCQEKNAYSSESAFQANLNFTLFNHFHTEAKTFGFSNFSTGNGDDQVYALYYCKGDVDASACLDCIEAAVRKVTEACKFWKEGIVWFEECTLRYADRTIFSTDEEDPHILYYNHTGIVNEVRLDPHIQEFESAMDALINQAAYSPRILPGFATKQVNISSSEILVGLAQCTPDIVGRPCYRCLRVAIRLRDTWANTAVFLPSCLLRYDLYEMMLPSPSSKPSPSHQGFRIDIIVALVVSVFVVIVLALVGGWFLPRIRRSQDREHGLTKFNYCEVRQMADFKKKLGKGACGEVYHGRLGVATEVAIKFATNREGRSQFRNEIEVCESIRHKNIVSLLGYCRLGPKMALVYEYMSKGDLKERLSGSLVLSWKERLQIAIDIAEGLHYLHELCHPRIMHRDMKPGNILLHEVNNKLHAKLADFGYSRIFPVEEVTSVETRVIGTFGYIDPEYHKTMRLNDKVDVYGFGVILIQLITGKAPSIKLDVVGLFLSHFKSGTTRDILDSKLCIDVGDGSLCKTAEVANSCVNLDPVERPQMSQIVVSLRQSLDMELRESEGSCSTSSAQMFITTPPQIPQISDSREDPKGKKILVSCGDTESLTVPSEAQENPGSFSLGSTSKARASPINFPANSEDREACGNSGSCAEGSTSRGTTDPIVSDTVREEPDA